MEGHCSAGQRPQWTVVPMEEEVSSFAMNYLSSLTKRFVRAAALYCYL